MSDVSKIMNQINIDNAESSLEDMIINLRKIGEDGYADIIEKILIKTIFMKAIDKNKIERLIREKVQISHEKQMVINVEFI